MANPQVTITLGCAGKKVVKETTGISDGGIRSASVRLGSKRSLAKSFGTSTDDSYYYNNKRTRGETSERSEIYGFSLDDPKDLRSKLTCKRISRHIELEIEKRKKAELHEKVSRAIRSLESPERSLLTKISSSSGAAEPPNMDSIRSSYTSQATNGARHKYPDRVAKYSNGFSIPRTAVDQLPHVPSIRHMDASRTAQVLIRDPLESTAERSLLIKIPSSRGAVEPPQMDSVSSSYTSLATSGERPQSSDIVAKYFNGFYTPRTAVDQLPHMPSIWPMDASRTAQFLINDPLEFSVPKIPLPTMSMAHVDSIKLVKELPPLTGSMFKVPFTDILPPTVSSFLYSLGLGKYTFNFQAEEIDMVALKQMGELDLKELGIPMGPRKKILFALHSRTKRQIVMSSCKLGTEADWQSPEGEDNRIRVPQWSPCNISARKPLHTRLEHVRRARGNVTSGLTNSAMPWGLLPYITGDVDEESK